MTNFSPYGIPYNHKAAGMPPTYLDNIPMTATRQPHPDFHDEAMPYRPRERSMEKAFRQLCCGSCWGFCAWIAGILVLLTGFIVLAVVLVSVCTRFHLGALRTDQLIIFPEVEACSRGCSAYKQQLSSSADVLNRHQLARDLNHNDYSII